MNTSTGAPPPQADSYRRQMADDALRYESDGSGLAALLTGVVIGFASASIFFGGILWVLW